MNVSKEELKKYDYYPLITEYYGDTLTPVSILSRLKEKSDTVFLLESAEQVGNRSRYSFLGFNPSLEIKVKNGEVEIINQSTVKVLTRNPNKLLESILKRFKSPILEGVPPFLGGLVGYFSYDYYKYQEPILEFKNPDPYNFYDAHLFLFKDLIVFDHFRDKILIVDNIKTDQFDSGLEKAKEKAQEILKIIHTPENSKDYLKITKEFEPIYSLDNYKNVIDKAIYHIKEGDIFQCVPSNRIKGEIEGSLFPAYRVLRSDNPSPYMYYLKFNNYEIAGASPETLIRLENGNLSTFPIAGSRPRGKTPEEDKALEVDLLSDPKELAEHNMLVDLSRNDLGQVSLPASVSVSDYMKINRFSKIMHITSQVNGKLDPKYSAMDALSAILPAGTLSGAPKIRACQIIEDLETEKRGPYGGAIGYFSLNSNMDFCITIRTAFKNKEKTYVQSGGGIVFDSQYEKEYEETVNKAAAVIEALKKAEELKNDFNFG